MTKTRSSGKMTTGIEAIDCGELIGTRPRARTKSTNSDIDSEDKSQDSANNTCKKTESDNEEENENDDDREENDDDEDECDCVSDLSSHESSNNPNLRLNIVLSKFWRIYSGQYEQIPLLDDILHECRDYVLHACHHMKGYLNNFVIFYALWIVGHYLSAHAYVYYCVPVDFKGFMISPLLTSTPHCKAFRWVIQNGGNNIDNMWVMIGTWLCAKIVTSWKKVKED